MPIASDAFRLTGPTLISFSAGRSSAEMLFQILDKHDGRLPDDVHVVFDNTGDEDERTLRFAHECGTRWGQLIHWIEYRDDDRGYEVVGYNSASRAGEPFDALIARKATDESPIGYVPNRGAPYCSIELKARTTRDWAYGELGWKGVRWNTALGLRHDEQPRVLGAIGRNHSGKDPWRNIMPLDAAKVTKRDVIHAWFGKDRIDLTIPPEELPRGFDLGLLDEEGNCVFCWKKSMAKRRRLIRRALDRNDTAQLLRWIERERRTETTFDLKWSMEEIVRSVIDEPTFLDRLGDLPDEFDDPSEECGFTCFTGDADKLELAA